MFAWKWRLKLDTAHQHCQCKIIIINKKNCKCQISCSTCVFNPLVLVQLSVFVLVDYPWYYWCSGDGTTVLVTVTCALPTLLCHYLPAGLGSYLPLFSRSEWGQIRHEISFGPVSENFSKSKKGELSLMAVLVSAVIFMTFPLWCTL